MSDAEAPLRRVIPEQRRTLSRELYLDACRAKGARTQEERAQLFGLPRQAVSRYECNKVEPLVSTAQHIAGRIDLTVEDLWVSEKAAA